MTRYTICFDEERDVDILRWMDAQVNKSMSLKALVERSIAQEGYNDIFQLAWKKNIQNSTQLPHEPMKASSEYSTQQPGRKRGRPRKNTSIHSTPSAPSLIIPETKAVEQSSINQHQNTAPPLMNASETVPAPEPSVEQNKEYLSDKAPAIQENESTKAAKENTGAENDGYRRPGNINIDMTKFL